MSCQLKAAWALIATALIPTLAAAQSDAPARKTAEQVAAELANPLAPITTFVTQFRTEFDNGPDGTSHYQLRLQPSFFKPLEGGSALLVRTILPLRKISFPTGAAGLGDISVVPYYVPDIRATTFVGYGAALNAPSATESVLGAGKWSAGPALLFAQMGKPITWGGLVQHVWSFAGQQDRADISATTLQPFVTYLPGGGWSITATSESSYNWQAPAGQRWLVPLALSASKVVELGDSFINVGVAYVNNLERPQFAAKSELRLSATYVFK